MGEWSESDEMLVMSESGDFSFVISGIITLIPVKCQCQLTVMLHSQTIYAELREYDYDIDTGSI